ncbi:ribosome small subunit-dependent GTPase A [uncultured Sphaerochaeta sp.]|uniref:ribosome small subunit-dependent GTPase A n=1 Tax=uncultured Sphaerochaeta sp. TaxID=886478 RepID=UPI002A0A34B6|nr:ribosome small subunit-dependent GTPase A [uncultured Sphaerochaeta sp.]
MEQHIGLVTRGINNIYSVSENENRYLCRIKGKQLTSVVGEYNPIAVGDMVAFVVSGTNEGLITDRLDRKNSFQRWNIKGQCNQTVVANMDMIVCVCSADTPPFRPRFIDRVIACCQEVPVMLVMNKNDIMLTEDEFERFALYKKLGYPIIGVSAKTGENLEDLNRMLAGKTVAFVGQSGVGKSTLINRLLSTEQKTNEVSAKYNRGKHTTNYSLMIEGPDYILVDTPGVREILVPHGDPHRIAESFPEFREPSKECSYDHCLHNDEPDCKVKLLVEQGKIHSDRYDSYLRMLASLDTKAPEWMGKSQQSNTRYKSMENDEQEEY